MLKKIAAAVLLFCMPLAANAATVTYSSIDLVNSLPSVQVDGLTLTPSTSDGLLNGINSPPFVGLNVGGSDLLGTYSLAFSQAISSITLTFVGLSNVGSETESMFGFATETGLVSVGFTNILGAAFDGTTVTTSVTDAEFQITYSGAAFTEFLFTHAQTSGFLGGVLITQIAVETVPLPASGLLLLGALGALAVRRRST